MCVCRASFTCEASFSTSATHTGGSITVPLQTHDPVWGVWAWRAKFPTWPEPHRGVYSRPPTFTRPGLSVARHYSCEHVARLTNHFSNRLIAVIRGPQHLHQRSSAYLYSALTVTQPVRFVRRRTGLGYFCADSIWHAIARTELCAQSRRTRSIERTCPDFVTRNPRSRATSLIACVSSTIGVMLITAMSLLPPCWAVVRSPVRICRGGSSRLARHIPGNAYRRQKEGYLLDWATPWD